MIIFHRQMLDEPAYYLDGSGKRYRRLVGGIGWPQAGQEGYAIVLSESEDDPPNYVVQAALKDHNAYALMEACKGLELEFQVKTWHGNPNNQPMIGLLYEFNRGKLGDSKLAFTGAPQTGQANNSGYYLPLVIEMVKVGQKRLSVGAAPELLAAITELDPTLHLNRDIADFPVLAALCYPLSYCLTYKPYHRRPEPENRYGKMGWQL